MVPALLSMLGVIQLDLVASWVGPGYEASTI